MRIVWSSIFAILCAMSSARVLHACANEYDEKPQPVATPLPVTEQLLKHEGRAFWRRKLAALQSKGRNNPDYRLKNDLAVALMHNGQSEKAIAHLKNIEKKQPGLYRTAANLGTAYELTGNNREALRWIREGLKRNAQSHNGSEWIHIRVLEAKVASQKPSSVLGLDFGSGSAPIEPVLLPLDSRGRNQTLLNVEKALKTQLHERLQFVSAPDALVASLLFDLGNCLASRNEREDAAGVYKMALRYQPVNRAAVEQRLNGVQPSWNSKLIAIVAILLSGLSFSAWRFASSSRTLRTNANR